jgi:hypothetical protein
MDVSRDLNYCMSSKQKWNTSDVTVVCLHLPVLCLWYVQRTLQIEMLIYCISLVSLQPVLKGFANHNCPINPLSTKLYLSDLKTQVVPRSKHSLLRF